MNQRMAYHGITADQVTRQEIESAARMARLTGNDQERLICEVALRAPVRDVFDLQGDEKVAALLRLMESDDLIRYHGPGNKVRRLARAVAWANVDAMKAKYVEARLLTQRTGVEHVVDHIIPLQGELASGLHVEANLQVIPAADNQQKYNKHEP